MQNKTINVMKTVGSVSVSSYSQAEKSDIFITNKHEISKYLAKRLIKMIITKQTCKEKLNVPGQLIRVLLLGIRGGWNKMEGWK